MTPLDDNTISYLLEGESWLLRGFGNDAEALLIAVANPALPVLAQERRLARELQLRSQLSPDWAAVPVALTRFSGQPALLLRDPGGYPLKRKLGQKLSLEEFLPLAVSLSSAIHRMHAAGILHRDITPSHLLVRQGGQAYITGFGIAQRMSEPYSATEMAHMVGTLAYLAPEQTGRTTHEVDGRADLYSLGVIFFQLLTGVLPFDASTPAEWLHAHLAMRPPDPAGYVTEIPPRLSGIVLKLLNKTPDDRFQDARTLHDELQCCLDEWITHARISSKRLHASRAVETGPQTAKDCLALGRNALHRSAYSAARTVFSAGLSLSSDPETAFAIHLGLAECDFRTGEADTARQRLQDLAAHCSDLVRLAEVVRLQIAVHTALDASNEAVALGLAYLARFGLVPDADIDAQIDSLYARLISGFDHDGTRKLLALPAMQDEGCRAAMSVLAELMSPASFMSRHLRDLVPAWMTMLSIERGNAPSSCIAYVHLGMVMGPRTGRYETGYQLGLAGVELSRGELSSPFRPKVNMCFGALLLPWTRPYAEGLEYVSTAYEEGRREGDVNFAAYSRNQIVSNMLASSMPLHEIRREIDLGLTFAREIGLRRVVDILLTQSGFIDTLNGRGRDFGEIIPIESRRREFEQRIAGDRSLSVAAFCYWVRKLQAKFLAGDYDAAWEARNHAAPLEWTAAYFPEVVDFHVYGALVAGALADSVGAAGKASLRTLACAAFDAHRARVDEYAAHAPRNFGGKQRLIEAEHERRQGRQMGALRLYEAAASVSALDGHLQDEALAYNLAARCCFDSGLDSVGGMYVEKACEVYRTWGADGVVRYLRKSWLKKGAGEGAMRQRPEAVTTGTHLHGTLAMLDIEAVIHASQALVGEVDLERLFAQLLTNTLRHGAAESGVLLLQEDGRTVAVGAARLREQEIVVSRASDDVAYNRAILAYALADGSDLFINDARHHPVFSYDDDIRRRNVRSVACLLLQKQSNPIGLLYLENNQISGAFTPGRSALLTMLAAQAAMAIENGRLYSRLLAENADRQKMQVELAHVSRVTSLGEMAASIAHEVGQPLAGILTYGDASLRWLDRQPPNVEEVTANIRKIINEGVRAGEIIQRVRDLATKDTGRFTELDVNALVRESVTLVQFQANAQHVDISVHGEDAVPPVRGDRIQLQQVIINLAVNAIQAMATLPHTRSRNLRLATSRSGENDVLIRIEDSGPGIPDSAVDRLFDAFFTTRAEGLGMGLSICRSIVDAHGGRIWLEQHAGDRTGCVFFVCLPAASAGNAPEQYHF
ncbi:ATP-binding protein [Cupriavidus sp. SW-Y-13]|uniref:ATP-binding protein n=1 Tax=Cupriavidus sp. SW-Y-13 TaxID=2653854 RepID=UPI001365FA99|nr:ATP-binding protein [Cupriavidus sp. SW-Y-13]MWL87750.1 protein kinase [Cupriavidus sp. SW-Y-13]